MQPTLVAKLLLHPPRLCVILRTGRLIHQGFQKQKRILFCYSGKTLATLSV